MFSCCFRVILSMFVLIYMIQAADCAASSDRVLCNITEPNACESGTFLNGSNCCQQCSPCPNNMVVDNACNSTHDTTCERKVCPNPATFFSPNDNNCVINCRLCPSGCEGNLCICEANKCYSNDFCVTVIPCPTQGVETVGPDPQPGNPSSLPSWGIGVIAVGVVLGIVAFSGGFLFMGVCTRKRRTEIDSESSEHSNSGLISRETDSVGTHSSYIIGYPNRSLFDVLRHTNSPTVSSCGSLSSVQFNQKSVHVLSSPLTVKKGIQLSDNYHLHTNSPAHSSRHSHNIPLSARTLQVNLDSKSTVV